MVHGAKSGSLFQNRFKPDGDEEHERMLSVDTRMFTREVSAELLAETSCRESGGGFTVSRVELHNRSRYRNRSRFVIILILIERFIDLRIGCNHSVF